MYEAVSSYLFWYSALSFFPIAASWEKPKDSKVVIPGQTGSSSQVIAVTSFPVVPILESLLLSRLALYAYRLALRNAE